MRKLSFMCFKLFVSETSLNSVRTNVLVQGPDLRDLVTPETLLDL